MIKIAILGASSLTSEVLIKILLKHPHTEIVFLESEHLNGVKVSDVHPSLLGLTDLKLKKLDEEVIIKKCDVVFMAKDNGYAHKAAGKFVKNGIKVIDLSADFRIKNATVHKKWYGFAHKDKRLLKKAVYGLPELYRDKIKKASIVANPGCYPTSIILACAPLLKVNVADSDGICIASSSGVSGAGRNPKPGMNLFMDSYRNIFPYKVTEHRHTPEIEQVLSDIKESTVKVTFIPHLVPIDRGILSTIFIDMKNKISLKELLEIYKEFYINDAFVRVCPPGKFPSTKNVEGTNFCEISAAIDNHTGKLIVISAIDNLFKGASGQAVQNMNLMCGLEEETGLL
ncbi:MAG: N-acetyl-gamma-glutamyl-phosphate reductase [Candidatus Schekmanbacteria bacterium]|nr:MAG: N-acetyl-gamma-glutamyl-phosphate reductase [Candidatus Schekmanbacteria bacterium]